MIISGRLEKMTHKNGNPVQYFLNLDDKRSPINSEVGKTLILSFLGVISCIECDRKIKKTYGDGFCFPCFRDLPENAICSVRPERCEHELGDEQDREFFREYCNIDHFVYLSLTSGVKVGVTRHFNIPSRWIDQGATQGLIIARTPQRKFSGQIEVALSKNMADKTNWRKMLSEEVSDIDLRDFRTRALKWIPKELRNFALDNQKVSFFKYPIISVPKKINSHNLDKEREFTDVLTGIKGQYLIFEKRVINLRKYSGYHIEFQFLN